ERSRNEPYSSRMRGGCAASTGMSSFSCAGTSSRDSSNAGSERSCSELTCFMRTIRALSGLARQRLREREVTLTEPQRDMHQGDQYRHFYQWSDDGSKGRRGCQAKRRDGNRNGKLKVVACSGKGKRRSAWIVRFNELTHHEAH